MRTIFMLLLLLWDTTAFASFTTPSHRDPADFKRFIHLRPTTERGIADANGNVYQTNRVPDGAYVILHYLKGMLQSRTAYGANGNQLGKTGFTYDGFLRIASNAMRGMGRHFIGITRRIR